MSERALFGMFALILLVNRLIQDSMRTIKLYEK